MQIYTIYGILLQMTTQERLEVSDLSLLLGSVNTEFKATVLGTISSEAPMTDRAIHHTIADLGGFSLVRRVSTSQVGETAARIPFPIATSVPSSETASGLRETIKHKPMGDFATALGGCLLDLSLRGNMPLRLLVGEGMRRESTDGTVSDAIINRVSLLAIMYKLGMNGNWIRQRVIAKAVAEHGVGWQSVRVNLVKLEQARIIETKTSNARYKHKLVRFRPEDDFSNTVDIVGEYLKTLGLFSVFDTEIQEAGKKRMSQIITDPTKLPYLIKRSFAASRHTGKDSPRPSYQART